MRNKIYSWLIGSGILFMAIHNRLLTITDSQGVTWFFLPTVGVYIAMLGVFACLAENHKKITFGSKWLWIPLSIIALSIIAAEVYQVAIGNKAIMQAYNNTLFAVFLFGLYLIARILKEDLFKPFTVAVIIMAISAIPYALILDAKTGGLASPTNYDMGAGLLIFGTLVSGLKQRWWLCSIAVIGLFFMGAEEGYFALAVLAATVIIRRDFGRRMLAPLGISIVGLLMLVVSGHLGVVVNPTLERFNQVALAAETDGIERDLLLDEATGYRWVTHWRLSPIQPLGYGYNIDKFYLGIPHNIVLIIIEQVGIIAALAWLFAMGYLLIKTKWRYAVIGVLALGLLDHYFWTQVAPWTWALSGVASVSDIKSDLIFRERV